MMLRSIQKRAARCSPAYAASANFFILTNMALGKFKVFDFLPFSNLSFLIQNYPPKSEILGLVELYEIFLHNRRRSFFYIKLWPSEKSFFGFLLFFEIN